MNSEQNKLLDDLISDLVITNVTVTYLNTGLTLIGKKVQAKHPELVEDKNKGVSIQFNGYTDYKHYKNRLQFYKKRLEYLINGKFNDKELYLTEFKQALAKVLIVKEKREVLFTREDITEYNDPKSDFWIDEIDEFIGLLKKRKVSDFVKIQESYLNKIIKILEPAKSITSIEDLVPNEQKRESLKSWLIQNGYCDNDFKWVDKSKGTKSKVAYLLGRIIPYKGFSNLVGIDNNSLKKIASNSFKVSLSISTIEKALHIDSKIHSLNPYNNLRI